MRHAAAQWLDFHRPRLARPVITRVVIVGGPFVSSCHRRGLRRSAGLAARSYPRTRFTTVARSQNRTMQPGDVLKLADTLPGVQKGYYVLLSISGECCLSAARVTPVGHVVATSTLVRVPFPHLFLFDRTGMEAEGLNGYH